MNPRLKTLLINLAKVAVAFGLVYWMVRTDKLDFAQIKTLMADPSFVFKSFLFWVIIVLFLGTFRWWLLLRGVRILAEFGRTMQLQMIGLFFNSTMPGAVGGDIIKAVYIVRDQVGQTKASAMLTILLDRVVGIMGLFSIGAIAISLNFDRLWQNPELRPLMLTIFASMGFVLIFFLVVFLPIREGRDPVERLLSKNIFGFPFAKTLYLALRSYQRKPATLIAAFGLSLLIQGANMVYFMWITELLNGAPVEFGSFSAVFPIGVATTALPLAPSGLGVGHLAFQKLYEFIGLENGANAFNVYLLVILFLNLTGIIPYLFLKNANKNKNARA